MPEFSAGSNAIIAGSHGGIGAALVSCLEQLGTFEKIFCLSRQVSSSNDDRIIPIKCNITIPESVELSRDVVSSQANKIDLIIIATGILHTDKLQPEKRIEEIDIDNMQQVFRINTFAPIFLAKTFAPLMNRQFPSVIAAISARVGSITDNRLGGWYSYRASKAALNMYFRTFAIEMKRKNPNLVVTLIHPGTTDTKLSAPFQKNVPMNRLFSAKKSATLMLDVINNLSLEDSGNFYAWDGKIIEW